MMHPHTHLPHTDAMIVRLIKITSQRLMPPFRLRIGRIFLETFDLCQLTRHLRRLRPKLRPTLLCGSSDSRPCTCWTTCLRSPKCAGPHIVESLAWPISWGFWLLLKPAVVCGDEMAVVDFTLSR